MMAAALPAAADEQPSAAQLMDDLMWNRGPIGGLFTLTDQTGKIRRDDEFRGKLMIVYFGYTSCPDVCPTDPMAISQAIDALGADGEKSSRSSSLSIRSATRRPSLPIMPPASSIPA